jgi:hypothetical protein
MYSPETVSRLETLRQLAQQRDLTTDEAKEVITLLRQGRAAASVAVTKSKAAKAKPDGAAVLAGLFAALGKPGGPT